ncbi:hypothetical protein CMQ_1655 [Grosmannia clavigera kw1407]|uniref:Uncharacterized protein n=1 Tax=Grosmannia clavigera (strain kw1407 / UAMH 11150) TaxID=655863 RepID=F0XES8_GROCL|nr:uncharacterized protein CMQ_1655 [Grosmannia clavigera kw1407]EFX04727.1 hypothetical protein CMQ_1655 [Grosmannia clavigera kw1407]
MQRRWRHKRDPLPCKFASWSPRRLECDICGGFQELRSFSLLNRAENIDKGRQRQCLGCEGAVQLCEHVHLSWATIQDHITSYWQGQLLTGRLGTWQACFDSFDFVCHDPSHDRRCTAAGEPT